MEAVIGVVVILLLIWISIKVAKFLIKVVLWIVAIAVILGLLAFYLPELNPLQKTPVKTPQTTQQKRSNSEKK